MVRSTAHFVLPLVPTYAGEASVLLGELGGKPLVAHVLDLLAAQEGAAVHVYTTDEAIAGYLESRGGPYEYEPVEGAGRRFQDGAALAVRHLLSSGKIEPSTSVILVDCRNPFLSRETLGACREHLAAHPGEGVASFEAVRDHPVQQFAAYRIEGIEILAFPDSSPEARELPGLFGLDAGARFTEPFFFDWRRMDVWTGAPALYSLETTPKRAMVVPRPEADPRSAMARGALVYAWESPLSARRLLASGEARDENEAVATQSAKPFLPLSCVRERPGGMVSCRYLGGQESGRRVLRVWPVRKASLLGFPAELDFDPADDISALTLSAAGGLLTTVLIHAEEGAHDHVERIDAPEYWAIDRLTKAPCHPETGRMFYNRQDFPAFLVRDDALCAGRADMLLAGGEPPHGWEKLVLCDVEGLKVRQPLDVLLAEAMLEDAGREASSGGVPARDPQELFLGALVAKPKVAPVSDSLSGASPSEPGATDASPLELAMLALRRDARESGARPRREAFDDIHMQLGWLLWRYRCLLNFLRRRGQDKDAVGYADAVADKKILNCMQLRGLLHELMAAGADAAPRTRGGRARPVGTPFFGLPNKPTTVVSDARSMLFLLGEGADGQPGLYSKCVRTGAANQVGTARENYGYNDLWFDTGADLLYAAFNMDSKGREATGVDVFDKQGGLVDRRFMKIDQFSVRPYMNRIRGNAASLFFVDYACWQIFELDKSTFDLVDIHDYHGVRVTGDFFCSDTSLYMTDREYGAIARHDFASGVTHYAVNADTLYPTVLTYDCAGGRLYVLAQPRVPHVVSPMGHVLKVFDTDLNLVHEARLGPMYALSVSVFESGTRVAVADYQADLRCYSLDED